MSAPATHSQPSRKGKRAWRKNIDIGEIASGLESARQEAIITGGKGLLADAPAELLFQSDITGDAGLAKRARKEFAHLKADEIIGQRSAVPALSSKRRAQIHDGESRKKHRTGVSTREYERLRQVAFGGSKDLIDSRNTEDGVIYDPWAESGTVDITSKTSYLERRKLVSEPKTLRHQPISLLASGRAVPNLRQPQAHTSYQPAASDWLEILEAEGNKAMATETRRLAEIEVEAEKEARVAAAAEEADLAERDGALVEYGSEWEGIASEVEETNRLKRPQRKTPSERNKIKRRKEAERLERHHAKTRIRDEQEKRIQAIRKEMKAQDAARLAVATRDSGSVVSDESEENEELKKRRFGERQIPARPLELVLPDELEDSLRRLKPEGNLLDERFRNLIVQGRVEARPKPIGQVRKKRTKSTEKWSYKDWKLD